MSNIDPNKNNDIPKSVNIPLINSTDTSTTSTNTVEETTTIHTTDTSTNTVEETTTIHTTDTSTNTIEETTTIHTTYNNIDNPSIYDIVSQKDSLDLDDKDCVKKFNYYLLEFDVNLKKFTSNGYNFKDNKNNFIKLNDDISNNSLYDLIIIHSKSNTVILPIYKGLLIRKNITLDKFNTPILLLKLNTDLLKINSPIYTSILNSFPDISGIINTLISQPIPLNYINENSESNSTENSEGNSTENSEGNSTENSEGNSTENSEGNSTENSEGNNEDIINSQNELAHFTRQYIGMYSNITENENKYRAQIEHIESMGFSDKNKIIQSLIVCNGDIEQAINYYLSI
jgi:hypothetical protein